MLSRMSWVGGTLELASKVRYGMTSRGVPIFRFIPYDKHMSPLAVGCSTRDLFYNVHAIVEPQPETKPNQLQKANIIQYDVTEQDVMLATYAYDNQKHLRKEFLIAELKPTVTDRVFVKEGFTFHIDPPGCLDADDSFTFEKKGICWKVWIHIADVASWISEDCPLDLNAQQRATTFYSPDGAALAPMLPRILSEEMASLSQPGPRSTLSLSFDWMPGEDPTNFQWHETVTECQARFTYEELNQGRVLAFGEEASEDVMSVPQLEALRHLARQLGGDVNDSHTWVEMLMILYNKKAGELLKENKAGVLRRQKGVKVKHFEPLCDLIIKDLGLSFLDYESAEYCLPTDIETEHFGIGADAYGYASSPLRRYVDLANQRCLKQIINRKPTTPFTQTFVDEMNRRGKQAKAFNRDLFFSSVVLEQKAKALQASSTPITQGTVLSTVNSKGKFEVYVSSWKRIVKVKFIDFFPEPSSSKFKDTLNFGTFGTAIECPSLRNPMVPGTKVQLSWYEDRTKPRWKERMVFEVRKEN